MVNNSRNINKTNNPLSPQTTLDIWRWNSRLRLWTGANMWRG